MCSVCVPCPCFHSLQKYPSSYASQTSFEAIVEMRAKTNDNLRKAVALLYGLRRDDGVSDEICNSFRRTVDAMTNAIEPNANSVAKEILRKTMAEFQRLVEDERAVEEGELATIGNGVAVSASELGDHAGLGLKAAGRSFAVGDRITKYDGERIQIPESQRRQSTSSRIADGCNPDKYAAAGYEVQTHIMACPAPGLGNRIYINGDRGEREDGRGGGSYANHNENPNAKAVGEGNQIILKAIKPIQDGDEIYINYGNGKDVAMGESRWVQVTNVNGQRDVEKVSLQSIYHSPTRMKVFFTDSERRARDAAPQMIEYNKRLAETYAGQPLNELVSKSPATDLTACASSILNAFMSQPTSFEGDGVKWIPAGANGNELHVGSEVGHGFGGYGYVRAPHPSREQQAKSTLRGLRPLYDAMVEMRDKLWSELLPAGVGLSVEFLQRIASDRLGAAFVISCVHLLEAARAIADAGELEDFHLANAANPNASFNHHTDNHAEHDDPSGAYIERSVGCLLSDVESSMAVAGIGQVNYGGQGSFVSFPAWAIHNSVPGDAAVAWKLVGFFRSKLEGEEAAAAGDSATDPAGDSAADPSGDSATDPAGESNGHSGGLGQQPSLSSATMEAYTVGLQQQQTRGSHIWLGLPCY